MPQPVYNTSISKKNNEIFYGKKIFITIPILFSNFDSALDFEFYTKFHHFDVVMYSLNFIYYYLFHRWPTMFSPTRS